MRPPRFCSSTVPMSTRWTIMALHPCTMRRYQNAHETAEVLLKHGADVNAMDDNGWTPLHYAVRCRTLMRQLRFCSSTVPTSTRGKMMALHPCTVRRMRTLVRPPRFCSSTAPMSTRWTIMALHPCTMRRCRTLMRPPRFCSSTVPTSTRWTIMAWTPLHRAAYENARETAALLRRQWWAALQYCGGER